MSELAIRLRGGMDADKHYIRETWLKAYRASMPDCPDDIYNNGMTFRINHLLDNAKVILACNPESPGRIYGWMCYEPGQVLTIHFVHTRYECRRSGVASMLFKAVGGNRDRLVLCSHKTARFDKLARKYELVHDESKIWASNEVNNDSCI